MDDLFDDIDDGPVYIKPSTIKAPKQQASTPCYKCLERLKSQQMLNLISQYQGE